jgi:hypothetical protein
MSSVATHRHVEKARKPATTHEEMAEREEEEHRRLHTYMERHPWPKLTAGFVGAAGLGLLAVSMIGVGPAAVAGAAGYLAIRQMTGKQSNGASRTRARSSHPSHH